MRGEDQRVTATVLAVSSSPHERQGRRERGRKIRTTFMDEEESCVHSYLLCRGLVEADNAIVHPPDVIDRGPGGGADDVVGLRCPPPRKVVPDVTFFFGAHTTPGRDRRPIGNMHLCGYLFDFTS